MIRPQDIKVGDVVWTCEPNIEASNYDAKPEPPQAFPVLEIDSWPLVLGGTRHQYRLGNPNGKSEFHVLAYPEAVFPDEAAASRHYLEYLTDRVEAAESDLRDYVAHRQKKGLA